MALIVGVMFLAGHPSLLRRYRQQVVLLDSAFTDESALIAHLEGMFGARVHQVNVQKVDLVNDTTLADVRFEVGKRPRAAAVVLADTAAPGAPLNGHVVRRSTGVQA